MAERDSDETSRMAARGMRRCTQQSKSKRTPWRKRDGSSLRSLSDSSEIGGDMKLSYDPKHNIAYLRIHEKVGQVTTIKISDEMNIDIAPDGTVYGIEFLNANDQLTEDRGAIIVELDGKRHEIKLVA
jgi:uncharacterized protein YuzE